MKAKLATFAAAVLIGTMAGFAGEEVKVGSPFDLKLGSEELAVRHPKLPSLSYSVFYDDPHLDAGRAWTNWYQQATVTFARPYHIFLTGRSCTLRKRTRNSTSTNCTRIVRKACHARTASR